MTDESLEQRRVLAIYEEAVRRFGVPFPDEAMAWICSQLDAEGIAYEEVSGDGAVS